MTVKDLLKLDFEIRDLGIRLPINLNGVDYNIYLNYMLGRSDINIFSEGKHILYKRFWEILNDC